MTAHADTPEISAVASPNAGTSARPSSESSIFTTAVAATNSNLARLSKTVVATSASLTGNSYGDITSSSHYRSIMNDMAPTIRRPEMQRRIFSFRSGAARVSRGSASIVGNDPPNLNLLLSKEMLLDLPESQYAYSLLQGFKATLPEPSAEETGKVNNKLVRSSKSKAKEPVLEPEPDLNGVQRLEKDKKDLIRKLQRIDVRKAIVIQGIHEIETRIEQLQSIKQRNLERLSKFEDQELELEDKLQVLDYRIELLHEDEELAQRKRDAEEEESEAPTNVSGPADTESISLFALGDSLDHYSDSASYHSESESNERKEYNGRDHVIQPDASDSDSDDEDEDEDEDDEAFAREMTASMREAWVSSFLEWEKLTGE
ncbi:hypothetical protein POJ06DRAFT_62986 [Lipomyces tetrasporus]|uniref:Uncharacterized protein n=1 Tax=Lipomyces tetrasporus TaxID=54092 RepID=A0AAD7VW77_9ASCO|nr:uncharacterized protein POJ06DRAFT_62986 [Lipomyces tetrasporus]KAJ8103105.1 hypothetical protein POJ06DRAFT_62986 [Lipomyces tetrasporus]